ncbi:uncharacterized protein LOC106711712 isoform X2 [Papilio machaon]|uniref:uncharacterized protein LOC106711712 isoform X2 n=1 Tax=Papilio machaon TaxID=76193 RepID=UPI0006EAF7C8|nr:uncharacterized protein LOC106711712 isoform X2 [Papilio machaon]
MDKYSLCRCCLAQPPDKQLKTTYTRLGKAEIYGDMLKECFEIHLPLGNSVDDGICDECVSRLCNAADFKKQVISCQKKFQTTLTKLNVKDEMDDTLVKLEYSDLEDGNNHFDYDFEEEFLDDELVKREEVLSKIISLEDVTIEKKIVKRNVKNLILEGNTSYFLLIL